MSDVARTTRSVGIDDELWDELAEMAQQMGSDRESLVNGALYTFASLNGFLPAPSVAPPAAVARARPESDRKQTSPAVVKRSLDPSAELDSLMNGPDVPGAGEGEGAAAPPLLFVTMRGRDDEPISKDQFIIGRSKDCDLCIENPKVNRMHAAVVRDGADYFIEDLGTVNGTWFNMQKIKRRKIEDGDEYVICSEKLRFSLR